MLRDKVAKRMDMDEVDRALEEQFFDGMEFYEPINHFEKEQRELILDVVNEKIRCILSMDPSKLGGKIFGLNIGGGGDDKLEGKASELMEQVNVLKNKYAEIEGHKAALLEELEKYKLKLQQYEFKFEKQLAETQKAKDRLEGIEDELGGASASAMAELEDKLQQQQADHESAMDAVNEENLLLQSSNRKLLAELEALRKGEGGGGLEAAISPQQVKNLNRRIKHLEVEKNDMEHQVEIMREALTQISEKQKKQHQKVAAARERLMPTKGLFKAAVFAGKLMNKVKKNRAERGDDRKVSFHGPTLPIPHLLELKELDEKREVYYTESSEKHAKAIKTNANPNLHSAVEPMITRIH